ncbi:MAG: sporulation transcription factor Spo0A [Limnochordia bacterium]|jgi:two-component system response regulator (stage 0 sporulation protein A)
MTIKLMVADDDRFFCRKIEELIVSDAELELVGIVHNGKSALEKIEELQPDVLLLDLVMPELDGIGVLEGLDRSKLGNLKVLVMSVFGQEELVSRVVALGADYFVVKPFDVELILQRAKELTEAHKLYNPQGFTQKQHDVEAEVVKLLVQCGIPAHYKGYTYLKEAIGLVIQEADLINKVTKKLYPTVAERCNTTPEKVERAIRHAIETAYTRGNLEVLNEIFAYTVDSQKGKPTNSSFIATIADRIRLGIKAS